MKWSHWVAIGLLVLAVLLGILIRGDSPPFNEEEHMTEYFRINGLNNIVFDGVLSARNYDISGPVEGMSNPLTREEVVSVVDNLPLEIRGHALGRGFSIITVPFQVWGTSESDSDLEDNLHDIHEMLEDAKLYIETQGARGTRTQLRFQLDNATQSSYKTVYWGEVDEQEARTVFDSEIRCARMEGLKLTLYCEPNWRPETAVTLGPNEIYCPSFEENADSLAPNEVADNWTLVATPTPDWESTIVLHGCYSQELVTDAANEGIDSAAFASGAINRTGVAYAWIHRTAGGEIRVQMYETGVGMKAESQLDVPPPGGWLTATGKDGASTWSRVVVSGTMPVNANHHLRIIADDAATTFYVDKCYWEWDTLVCPDEWISHWLNYNHFDARWLPNKAGGAGAGDVGHINYVDMDDLKGDVESRIFMCTEFDVKADEDYARHLIVGRRTELEPGCFLHWWEAEDRTSMTNWVIQALARCSAGNCVSDAANATGDIGWATFGILDVDAHKGRFDVFGAVYTDDEVNTRYRLSYSTPWTPRTYNKWAWQPSPDAWQLIRLGEVDMSSYVRDGISLANLRIWVEYAKDAADTAKLDFIWLVPKLEPEMRLDLPNTLYLILGNWWAVRNVDDFDYMATESLAPPLLASNPISLHGQVMPLSPRIENRLYLSCITYDSPIDIWEAHGAATDLQMIVNIDYLPQYISPLE